MHAKIRESAFKFEGREAHRRYRRAVHPELAEIQAVPTDTLKLGEAG
jgi:hypothetical protein